MLYYMHAYLYLKKKKREKRAAIITTSEVCVYRPYTTRSGLDSIQLATKTLLNLKTFLIKNIKTLP